MNTSILKLRYLVADTTTRTVVEKRTCKSPNQNRRIGHYLEVAGFLALQLSCATYGVYALLHLGN